jgi:hypothetical protein
VQHRDVVVGLRVITVTYAEAHFENAGFSLAIGGVSGRRLALDHSVEGFFTAVQGVEAEGWTCQDSAGIWEFWILCLFFVPGFGSSAKVAELRARIQIRSKQIRCREQLWIVWILEQSPQSLAEQDVPLPSLPETYTQQLTIYRPCAVEGVTGSSMDMCDSLFGGVVPGTAKLPRSHQLATMSKTARIRAQLSVDVPINGTLFLGFDLEVMKSASYELQISSLPNHPGQNKVNIFDRRTSEDIYFQILSGAPSEGRFFCNTSGSEETPQKKAVLGEQSGVSRAMHFELLDMVEESGKIFRHFRMMPEESFLEWMGAKAAADRPTDAYYEYWDDAETMAPYRLLNPDGSQRRPLGAS